MSARRVRCKMCGDLTDRPRTVCAAPADGRGEPVPGARVQAWKVCPSCASLLDDGDDDESDDY